NRFQTEDEKNTKMDRCAFHALCNMLKRLERLEPSRNMGVEEMVAMFLHIIAHDVKIRVIKRQFVRSEETISRRFNDDCLGALDGTHIKVNVLEADKPRYRNRKGDITTNVFGVVAPDMQFIYVLAGWEGSAVDSRKKYHLSDFNPHNQPSTAQELFNMKHSQVRNVIEEHL
ncbi:hypothetical protein S83_046810, partial [Arachis hypogaea]